MNSTRIGHYDFTGMTVLIAGMGTSGTHVNNILRAHDIKTITVDEKKTNADLHSFADVDWNTINLIVISPIFTPQTDWVLTAQRLGIPIWSEIEFAWRTQTNHKNTNKPIPWIGITGTNGKTTTTEMISAIMTADNKKAPAVGNIGVSVSQAAQNPTNDILCVELSSFALHFTQSLHLDIAVWTNIDQDHLDWHNGFENYCNDKAKIFTNARHAIIYNHDDTQVTRIAHTAPTEQGCQRIGFTLNKPKTGSIGIENGWILDRALNNTPQGRPIMALAEVNDTLKDTNGTIYPHLASDALAATAACLAFGTPLEAIHSALAAFHPDAHRIQPVASHRLVGKQAIHFIDDSKATNGHAASASLASFPDGSVVWIVGGLAKGSRFEDLVRVCRSKLAAAVVIGVDRIPFLKALESEAPDVPRVEIEGDSGEAVMRKAVDVAMSFAHPGDVVLLAPAAASMDQFANMADRGDKFAAAARAWIEQHA
ncbi:MAG: UDP-N-acetylmuramoyl-L-alanine--D-glutamate ligase [Bifidobacteriaceae bacterium]|nr:UDP-N-acetylmuramoyl-L-alanine--D-glutamate ligase [Bifidobacteriaceae bacterium]